MFVFVLLLLSSKGIDIFLSGEINTLISLRTTKSLRFEAPQAFDLKFSIAFSSPVTMEL